jgi:hypothetical protein
VTFPSEQVNAFHAEMMNESNKEKERKEGRDTSSTKQKKVRTSISYLNFHKDQKMNSNCY